MNSRFAFLLLLCVAACSSNKSAATDVPADAGDPDGGGTTDATPGGTQCSKARDDLLIPVDKVSTGAVSIVSDTGGVKTLYIDASGGGFGNSTKNPRVYINLGTGTKVSVTDKTAPDSTEWDLALRRAIIWTNSGDAGVGVGGGLQVAKSFASVTAADGAEVTKEKFFDDNCKAQTDQTGAPATTFSDWYDYDLATNQVTGPKAVTYVVRGATGTMYKVGIKSFVGTPDGGTMGTVTGSFIIQVAAL